MGNYVCCMLFEDEKKKKSLKDHPRHQQQKKGPELLKSKSSRKARLEEELLHQQALAMVLYHEQLRLDKSSSVRSQGSPMPMAKQSNFPRSASVRARQVNDPILKPHQLLDNKKEASLKAVTKDFILVHGGGFGAWCWYKLIAMLEDAGFAANTLDLTGSGIDPTDPNCITNLELFAKPLTHFLEKLPEGTKVILVGHDVGGACISYAMEMFPQKIAKAVFLCATMVTDGQRALDVFSPEVVTPEDLLPKAQIFNYANKSSQSPTSIEFSKDLLKELLFNQSPSKDVALATVSIRPVPFGPITERLSLTSECYGSIPRYFIMTTEDQALTIAVQENILKLNPPNGVFRLKGSDHAPFFSKPQALYKVLVEISQISSKQN